ncbi:hypothetical protein [Paraclostridium bifermentans]|uniref:hypothetical protein n=1 Tax=Paraclostridium bifermentans TaxID=1490 RepID=UPI00115A1416|nr:hypothetical protein [Paraclostridium bifermentans]TQO59351.1 hypothetical protein D5S05_02450 [Paraclostridium bifermentans]
MNDKDTLLKASKACHEMADLYKELADMVDCEDTQENQDKLATIVGKIVFKASEIQEINF